jgi:hypothetical protein
VVESEANQSFNNKINNENVELKENHIELEINHNSSIFKENEIFIFALSLDPNSLLVNIF